MAKWSDVITLISVSYHTDDEGFYITDVEEKRNIFANKKSVGYSEYWKSAQEGYATEIIFQVYSHEYNGENFVEFCGKRYKVQHTYESKNGEFTELKLSDLSTCPHVFEETNTAPEGGGADGEI